MREAVHQEKGSYVTTCRNQSTCNYRDDDQEGKARWLPCSVTQVDTRCHLIGLSAIKCALCLLCFFGQIEMHQNIETLLITGINRNSCRTNGLCNRQTQWTRKKDKHNGKKNHRRIMESYEMRDTSDPAMRVIFHLRTTLLDQQLLTFTQFLSYDLYDPWNCFVVLNREDISWKWLVCNVL